MSKQMEFFGKIGGDGDCWCLFVSPEEYKRVLGEEDYQLELEAQKEFEEDMGLDSPEEEDRLWKLYPSDFFFALGVEDKKKIRFRLEVVNEEGA